MFCCGLVRAIYPHLLGVFHYLPNIHTIASLPEKQPWNVWIYGAYQSTRGNLQHSTTKTCGYFIVHTVFIDMNDYNLTLKDYGNFVPLHQARHRQHLKTLTNSVQGLKCSNVYDYSDVKRKSFWPSKYISMTHIGLLFNDIQTHSFYQSGLKPVVLQLYWPSSIMSCVFFTYFTTVNLLSFCMNHLI